MTEESITEEKTSEEYFNLLGMFGTVLHHIGGRIEVPFEELEAVDLNKQELTTWFDPANNVFVFELKAVIDG